MSDRGGVFGYIYIYIERERYIIYNMYTSIYIYIYTYVYIYIYIYIYTYTPANLRASPLRFPHLSKVNSICSGPSSVDPTCPQPNIELMIRIRYRTLIKHHTRHRTERPTYYDDHDVSRCNPHIARFTSYYCVLQLYIVCCR